MKNLLCKEKPNIFKLLHPNLNNITQLEQLTCGNKNKYWWQCYKSEDHIWKASAPNIIKSVEIYKTNGCPFCLNRKVNKSNSLYTIYPDVAKLWHNKNNIQPNNVPCSSKRKFWWQCQKVKDHEWETSIETIVRCIIKNKNNGCPCCKNFKIVNSNCLETTHPNISKNWDYTKNYPITPKQIGVYNSSKFWWICPKNSEHRWQTSPNKLLYVLNLRDSYGCPHCLYKGQTLTGYCLDQLNCKIIKQYKINKFRVDFYFEKDNKKYIVEYNGRQHYEPIKKFGGIKMFKKQQIRDQNLRDFCQQNEINLIEIDGRKYHKKKDILEFLSGIIVNN